MSGRIYTGGNFYYYSDFKPSTYLVGKKEVLILLMGETGCGKEHIHKLILQLPCLRHNGRCGQRCQVCNSV